MGKKDTESIIIQAATEEFIQSGFDGCRMRAISERASINKGLLHYYFKSKEALFSRVFVFMFGHLMSRIEEVLSSEKHLFDKIELFTSTYISAAIENPKLPRFIISELNRKPDRLINEMKNQNKRKLFINWKMSVDEAKNAGEIIDISPDHLFVNILSQCLFPFIAKPMIQYMMEMDEKAYKTFIQQRKKLIADSVIQSIKTS